MLQHYESSPTAFDASANFNVSFPDTSRVELFFVCFFFYQFQLLLAVLLAASMFSYIHYFQVDLLKTRVKCGKITLQPLEQLLVPAETLSFC